MISSGNRKRRAAVLNGAAAMCRPFSFPRVVPTHASDHLLPLSHCGSDTITALDPTDEQNLFIPF